MNTDARHDRKTWLEGPPQKCADAAQPVGSPWRLVLLGPPGVGKGTQAEYLSKELGACHLSTGDVFRAARNRSEQEQTPALAEALESMRRGALVSDSIVSDIVRERLDCIRCPGGFLFDGFPRTLAQAEMLQQLMEHEQLALNAVINYELPQAEIIARLSGRRTCERCKAIFHVVTKPPRAEGLCDQCGERLYQRDDDRPESITVRMQAYETSTAPLIRFYEKLGLLVPIAATGSPDDIFTRTIRTLNARAPARTATQLC